MSINFYLWQTLKYWVRVREGGRLFPALLVLHPLWLPLIFPFALPDNKVLQLPWQRWSRITPEGSTSSSAFELFVFNHLLQFICILLLHYKEANYQKPWMNNWLSAAPASLTLVNKPVTQENERTWWCHQLWWWWSSAPSVWRWRCPKMVETGGPPLQPNPDTQPTSSWSQSHKHNFTFARHIYVYIL